MGEPRTTRPAAPRQGSPRLQESTLLATARNAFLATARSAALVICATHALATPAAPTPAHPQALALPPGDAAPRIDGHLDDPAWQRAPVHDSFYQYEPEDDEPAPDNLRTTLQVLITEQALIVGLRAWDDQPALMRSALTRRDQVKRDQDFVAIWLDPTGHKRAAQFVRISLAGVVADGLYRADEDEEDYGPDFPVEAAVQRLPDGYSVELRWPLSSLRYPYKAGLPWRIMAVRSVPHADDLLLVSAPLAQDSLSFIEELQELGGLGETLQAVRDRGFIEFKPEFTARRQRRTGEAGRSRRDSASLGADLKWRPRADWVLDATLNPDYSQVELDAPPNTGAGAIALSLPEKRGFFLESADVLGLPLPAFYSRTIADPRAGLRATWRGTQADATALSLADQDGSLLLRGSPYETQDWLQTRDSSASLLRARWHGDPAAWGMLLSQRDHGEGRRNSVAGIDGRWRTASGEDAETHLRWIAMASQNTAGFDGEGLPLRTARRDGRYGWAEWRYSSEQWWHEAEWEWISPGFVNDNGFVAQAGVRRLSANLNRRLGETRLGGGESGEGGLALYEVEAHLGLHEIRTLPDAAGGVPGGEVVEQQLRPGFWVQGPLRSELWMELGFDRQRARTRGQLHPVPALHLGFEGAPLPWLTRVTGEFSLGRLLDVDADRVGRGANLWLEMQTRFPLPRGWSLESDHAWTGTWVRGSDGRSAFTEGSWRWLAVLHVSARDSLRLIAQNTRDFRRSDALAGLESYADRQRHRSLMFRREWGYGRSWSVGLVREREDPLRDRYEELFLKLQWAWAL
ncbi:MAG TPA: DUF5916 domain-containing protein [Ideonella sp.]|nr:DUF5916 domain-containing protein [Ideonella sp.]